MSSASATETSTGLGISSSQTVLPQPPKSSIPPSSRHQAVIGIPGGGAIPSHVPAYSTHIAHSLEPTTTLSSASTLTTAALAPRPLPAIPPQLPRPHLVQHGMRMLVKGGAPVRMMMIRQPVPPGTATQISPMAPPPSRSPQQQQTPMPPPPSRSPHHPQSPSSRVSPAQSPVANSPLMTSPSQSPHSTASAPPREDRQNALLKQLLQNDTGNQQFVLVRGSLNPSVSQVPQSPTPIILPAQHQRPVLNHHHQGQAPQPVLIPSGQLHQQQQRLPAQTHRINSAPTTQVVIATNQTSAQAPGQTGHSFSTTPTSQQHSPVHVQHPAVRQLPPSPTPHLDELVEEDRNNANKKRAAAGVSMGVPQQTGAANSAANSVNQPRRRSQSKDGPNKAAPRRARPEEDYDTFIDSMMTQLRTMPALTIMDPSVYSNFNVCPIYGSGEITKLGRPDHDHRNGKLEGTYGKLKVKDSFDYYDTKPFGPTLPIIPPLKPSSTRGFYSMEFPPPKIGFPLDEQCDEIASLTGSTATTATVNGTATPARPISNAGSLMADSPDTVLTSSSPESVLPDSPHPFRGLRLIDMEEEIPERCSSPPIPLLAPIPLRKGDLPRMSTGICHQIPPVKQEMPKILPTPITKTDPNIKQEIKKEDSPDNKVASVVPKIKEEPMDIDPPKDSLPSMVDEKVKEDKENLYDNDSFSSIMLKNRVGENPALPLKHEGNVTVEMTLPSNACEDIAGVLRSLSNILNIPPPKIYDIKHEGPLPKMPKKWKLNDKQDVVVETILNGVTKFCKQCNCVADKTPIKKKVSEMPYIKRDELIGIDDVTFCGRPCFIQYTLANRIDIPQPPPLKQEPMEESDNSEEEDDSSSEQGSKRKLEEEEEEEFPMQPDGKRYRGHKYRMYNGDNLLQRTLKHLTDAPGFSQCSQIIPNDFFIPVSTLTSEPLIVS